MKLMQKLFYLFPPKQRLQFVGMFILQLVGTAIDFFGVALILPFVNILVSTDTLGNTWWFQLIVRLTGQTSTNSVLLFLTLVMMGAFVLKNLFSLFLINLRVRFIGNNQIRMGTRMIRCYMYKPYTFHLQRNTSEIIRNINADVGGTFSVVSAIFGLISDGLIVIVLTIYLFAVDFVMTMGILVALALCSALYFLVVRKKNRSIGSEMRKVTAQKYKAISQAMGGIKEVKIMGREEYFARVYNQAGAQSVELSRKYSLICALPNILIETLCVCTILTIIALKIHAGEDLSEIVPGLSAFAIAALRLMPRAGSINGNINTITYNKPSLEALYQDLKDSDREAEKRREEILQKQAQTPRVPRGEEKSILLRDITYTYPNRREPVLKDVNLTIRTGESVGIVGVTGAGKTTLVDVILGLLKPEKGTVCYGSLDIHQDYAQWQKHIGYIPQNIYLVDDTIRNNVALGLDAREVSDEGVWRALENAQAADFVRSLEKGLDTVIGERGIRISGGQRQRIGIARALYYDPEILFFDEATSALDNETEAALMHSIEALGGKKTMVIVAHRLTTLAGCDHIYKVENGRIQETELKL